MNITTDADQSRMLDAIAEMPRHLREAAAAGASVRTAIQQRWAEAGVGDRPRTVLVCGMGGSGIGADLVPAIFDTTVPVLAVKDYDLPAWAGSQDAVVCVSYSGGTEETLSAWGQAVGRSVPVAAVTTGGELGERASAEAVPVVSVESGLQPRAAVGWLFGALAGVLDALGVIEGADRALGAAADAAKSVVSQHADWARGAADTAPAVTLAGELSGSVPVMYGVGHTVVVAQRWKAQINENSKLPAFANAYPELDHNEIVGWEGSSAAGSRISLVELLPADLAGRADLRSSVTRELVAEDAHATVRLAATETSRAGQVFELLAIGDYVSVALALARNIDPTPVERIQQLKRRLADG